MMRRLILLLSLCLTLPAFAQELLDVDKAFRLSARALDANTLEVRYDVAKGYYMYRDKFRFALEPAEAKAGEAQLPPGKVKRDEFFGDVETYRKEVVILLPITAPAGLDGVALKATSQGCADIGVCYPPNTQTLKVSLAATGAAPAVALSAAAGEDETSQLAGLLKNAGFWLVLTTFFGAGVLLAFTPCVFPMYPILSGIIVGHGHRITKGRAFVLSMAYVLGMAVAYAAAGVAAGLSGSMLSAALQNAWVLGAFAALFVVLSLSMFGFYELQLPTFLQSKLSEESGHIKGGSLHGVAAMGALSALIVGPCVAAPLAGALLYLRSAGAAGEHVAFERVRTMAELDARLAAADRPVMLDFYADWCVSCKEMEKYTFSDAQVAAQMRRMTLLQVDVTANTDEDKALLKRFGLFGPPGIIFFDRQGQERKNLRVVGYQPADRFIKVVNTALGG